MDIVKYEISICKQGDLPVQLKDSKFSDPTCTTDFFVHWFKLIVANGVSFSKIFSQICCLGEVPNSHNMVDTINS